MNEPTARDVLPSSQSAQLLPPVPNGRVTPRGFSRLFLAYRVTFVVIASYYFLRFRLRFASDERALRLMTATHLRNARRILRGIERLQGLFIKVGQLISILSNVLPEEFRSELTTLQDRVPPRPYEDIEKRFREEFKGRGPLQVFAEFSRTPVASASIGQVHRARTYSGIDVAVKVQYPDINEIVRLDLRALGRIFGILHWLAPQHGMQAVFAEIRDMILAELDFGLEAKNSQRIAENFKSSSASSLRLDGERAAPLSVAFPEVFSDFSTGRVLTTRWVDGIKVSNLARLDELGIDRGALARTVVTAYCQQIFRDGIYHADPHPGNLLVLPGPRTPNGTSSDSGGDGSATLVFLDFGAVAELSPRMRRGIVEVLQAALTRDTPRLVSAMKDMGFIARGADPEIFERVVDFFHDKLQAEVKLDSFSLSDVRLKPEMKFEVLSDLRRLNVSLRDLLQHFHVPKEWILLERTLLLLLGLCTELDSKLEPMQVIRPYISEFVLGKDRDLSRLLVETTRDVLGTALALPGDLRRFLSRAQRGQLEVRFRGVDEGARLLYTLGHQIIYAACGIAAFAASIIWEGRGDYDRADVAQWTCGVFGVFLLWSMLTTRARSKRGAHPVSAVEKQDRRRARLARGCGWRWLACVRGTGSPGPSCRERRRELPLRPGSGSGSAGGPEARARAGSTTWPAPHRPAARLPDPAVRRRNTGWRSADAEARWDRDPGPARQPDSRRFQAADRESRHSACCASNRKAPSHARARGNQPRAARCAASTGACGSSR